MKVGDYILTINRKELTPNKINFMHNKDYIFRTKNSKSQSKVSTNSNTCGKKIYDSTTDLKGIKKFCLDKQVSSLKSIYNISIKTSIIHSKKLELVKNQLKKLKADEIQEKINKCKSAKQREKKIFSKKEYDKKKLLINHLKLNKEKETKEKKARIIDLKSKEEYKNRQREIHIAKNSERKMKEIKDRKREWSAHIKREREKRKEENKKKRERIKKMDAEIKKRKKQNEKVKNLMMIEQLEKKIKIQEEINAKLLKKIIDFQDICMGKIDKLHKKRNLMDIINDKAKH